MTSSEREPLADVLARTLDAEPELVPLLPALLADLEDLGARADDIVELVRGAGPAAGTRVLDLGCGKGAAALALSAAFGVQVRGVDGMPAFVAHAQTRAETLGLNESCTFEVGDIRDEVVAATDYDIVMLLALGDVLGDMRLTLRALRGCIRAGGFVVLDDAIITERAAAEGFSHPGCFDGPTALGFIEDEGLRVLGTVTADGEENERWLHEMTDKVLARAQALTTQHPEHAEALEEFATRQIEETADLTGPVVGVTWLLQAT